MHLLMYKLGTVHQVNQLQETFNHVVGNTTQWMYVHMDRTHGAIKDW